MPAPEVHLVPDGGRWRIVIAGLYDDKEQAETVARSIASKTDAELVLHNEDGSIGKGHGSKTSYGNDPPEIPG